MTETSQIEAVQSESPGVYDGQEAAVVAGLIVGVDGSEDSKRALRWAAAQVGHFGLIQPAASWNFPWWGVTLSPLPGAIPPSVANYEGEARLRAELALESIDDDLQLPLVVSWSSAGRMLVDLAAEANLIVVGTRGRGPIVDTILGSTSSFVASHATVPVAVVPEEAPIGHPNGRVVVAVDGSNNSIKALVWALKNSPDESVVEAAHIWNFSTETPAGEGMNLSTEALEKVAWANLGKWVDRAKSQTRIDREVEKTIEYGDPRVFLEAKSREVDWLVLGARGHRGIAHLLLGSVATTLLHMPKTTTIVIPDEA